MSTHMPVFQSFFRVLDHFVLTKLATSSISVKVPGLRAPFATRYSEVLVVQCACAITG